MVFIKEKGLDFWPLSVMVTEAALLSKSEGQYG